MVLETLEVFGLTYGVMYVFYRIMELNIFREFLRSGDVAALLGISVCRVNQLRKSGELPATVTALGYLFAAKDVESLRMERLRNPPKLGRRPLPR